MVDPVHNLTLSVSSLKLCESTQIAVRTPLLAQVFTLDRPIERRLRAAWHWTASGGFNRSIPWNRAEITEQAISTNAAQITWRMECQDPCSTHWSRLHDHSGNCFYGWRASEIRVQQEHEFDCPARKSSVFVHKGRTTLSGVRMEGGRWYNQYRYFSRWP